MCAAVPQHRLAAARQRKLCRITAMLSLFRDTGLFTGTGVSRSCVGEVHACIHLHAAYGCWPHRCMSPWTQRNFKSLQYPPHTPLSVAAFTNVKRHDVLSVLHISDPRKTNLPRNLHPTYLHRYYEVEWALGKTFGIRLPYAYAPYLRACTMCMKKLPTCLPPPKLRGEAA